DLNGDGKLDLSFLAPIKPPPNVHYPTVMLGNGDGTFAAPQVVPPIPGATGVGWFSIADVNKDGKLDLVALTITSSTEAMRLAVSLPLRFNLHRERQAPVR